MNRTVSLIVFSILLLGPEFARAEDPPYLDFVRALREKRRAPDLALEYLQELVKKPTVPKDLLPLLALEMANSRVDLAQVETDPDAKAALYSQAEKDYRVFLEKNPNSPLAAGANLQLARIVAQQGKSQLSLALRQETKEAKRVEEEKARAKFQAAAGALAAASAQIDAQLQKPGLSPTERKALSHDKILASFEHGVDLFYQAMTYPDDATRSQTIGQARDIFKKATTAGDEKNSVYWETRAWLGRCYAETDDPKNADTELSAVIRHEGPEAEPGKRMALYFRLRFMERDPSIKGDRSKLIEAESLKWLKSYPEYENSPEGYFVRFQLAKNYISQALRIPNQKVESAALYSKAETLLDAIERTDNDYHQEAHDLKLRTVLKRSSELSGGDINKLANFQECFLRAKAEIIQMGDEEEGAPKTPQKDFEAKRQKHYDNIIHALTRALDMVDEKVPPQDQSEAQFILTYAYAITGEPYRAALLGEELARRESKSSRAANAAGYALQAYSQILAQEEQENAPKTYLDADREQIRKLAAFMEATWPKDPATNLARHQLGKLALRDKNYIEAIDFLARITREYPGYTASQYDLALFAAYPAMKDKVAPPQGQPPTYFQDQAIAALRRIPEPAPDTDAGTLKYYLLGKQQLAFLLLGAKQFQEMQQVTIQLQKHFQEAKLSDDFKKALEPAMESLRTLAKYSEAEVAFRAGKYDQAKKVIDPMLKQISDQVKAGKDAEAKAQKEHDDLDAALQKKIEKKETIQDEEQKKLDALTETVKRLDQQNHWKGQLLRSLLVLALRSKVQEGDTKQAHEVFDLLKSTSGYFEGGATGVLLEIVQHLKVQIGELEKEAAKDLAKKTKLEKIVAGFTTFLDQLGEQPAVLSEDLVAFVANSYSGMRKHAKAAAFLAKFPAPATSKSPPGEKPDDKEKREQEDKRKEAFYRHVRLLYVRELRLDKQFDKAGAEMKVILKDWGRNNLDAWKEQIFILEDSGKFAAAGNLCTTVMKEKLRPYVNKDNRLTDQYYECYYHLVFCLFHHGMKQTDPAKKREYIERAAKLVLELERKKVTLSDNVKKMFDDFQAKESVFRKYYEEQKKAEKAALKG